MRGKGEGMEILDQKVNDKPDDGAVEDGCGDDIEPGEGMEWDLGWA